MKKKVSMIIPVYNAERYLGRCTESLLSQTYDNIEIILINDGSTDGSGRICDELAAQYDKIKVYHTENSGVSAARNKGMEECSGNYITFVDADDYPAKDMVEHLVSIMERTDSDVSGCSYQAFGNKAGYPVWDKTERLQSADVSSLEILSGAEFIEKGILKSDTRCWSKLYKKKSIGGLRFDTGLTIGEDMLFLLELAKEGKKFCRSSYKGYGYFINEEGAMMHRFRDSYMDQITCWQQALAVIENVAPHLVNRAEAILLISVMLVVGKLSMLSAAEWKGKREYVKRCSDMVREYGSHRCVFRELDRGYGVKVRIYRYMPWGYMVLYHFYLLLVK